MNSAISVASSVHVAAAAMCLPICKSGFSNIPATVAEFLGQFVDDVL